MEHFYHTLEGENWFDYDFLYREMVEKFPSGSHFVELGAWKGKSASYMAVEIINSGKKIKFDCIDSWELGQTRNDFFANTKEVADSINLVEGISWEVADGYEDESIDFCFIDANHRYDAVKKDILAWLPKIKKGGVLAGHDYNPIVEEENGVATAVNELLKNVKIENINKWVYHKI